MNGRALALGFFDGVHPAHKQVLALARQYALENGLTASAVTFKMQPAAFIRGEQEQLLCTLSDRIRLLQAEGEMDSVIGRPSLANRSIRSARPQVDREICRHPMFSPSGWETRRMKRTTWS